jgi:hypothetical protein
MRGIATADIGIRVSADGRISIALGISIALHVVAFIVLVAVMRFSPPAYPSGPYDTIVLQARLAADGGVRPAEPEPVAIVEELSQRTTAAAPAMPPAEPARAPADQVSAPAAQAPGPGGGNESSIQQTPTAAAGAPELPVMITIRASRDLSKLPSSTAEILGQRFADPVQKSPELRVPLLVLYPQEALDQRRNARITAALAITENGEISNRAIIPDDPVFGPAIIEALKDARFNPAEIDGRAVAYWTVIEFVFTVGQATLPKGLN